MRNKLEMQSLDVTIMLSKNCTIIGEQVVFISVTQRIYIASVWPSKNTFNYNSKG